MRYCTVLYCTVLYSAVLYCAVLYCAVLCCVIVMVMAIGFDDGLKVILIRLDDVVTEEYDRSDLHMDEHADLQAVDETPHTLHTRHTLHSAIKYNLTQPLTYDKNPIQQKILCYTKLFKSNKNKTNYYKTN